MIKNNCLTITNIHKNGLDIFYKKFTLLLKKNCINFYYFNKKKCNKKLTILRSPHVNKSARDQIEVNNLKHFFIFNSLNLTEFFLHFLKKNKTHLFNYHYQFNLKQTLFFYFKL